MAETTTTAAKGWAPDVKYFAPKDILPESLLFQISSVLGSVEGDEPLARVVYVDDDDDPDAGFVAEGDEIPQDDPPLSEVLVATGKVAKLLRVSYELWSQDGTAPALSEAVRNVIQERADRKFLTQAAPVAPAINPPTGLLNVPGITVLDTPVSDNLDALIDLGALLETLGSHPSHWLMSPTAWAAMSKLKVRTDSAENLLGAGLAAGDRRVLGLPVITSRFMPGLQGMLIDKRAIVAAAGPVRVAQSEHAFFTRDSLALRATFRFGQNVVHPNRIAKFTVAPAAA